MILAQISSHITENELEHAVNWYFSLGNVQAANDRIVAAMDQMELPNVYRRAQDQLHTSATGRNLKSAPIRSMPITPSSIS